MLTVIAQGGMAIGCVAAQCCAANAMGHPNSHRHAIQILCGSGTRLHFVL